MKNTTRKSFPFFLSWEDSIQMLSNDEKAKFLDNLMAFYKGQEVDNDTPMLKMFWASIKNYLDDSVKKYDEQVERSRKATQSRLQNSTVAVPHDTTTVPHDTIMESNKIAVPQRFRPSKDKDNDNDKGNEKENVNGKKKIMWEDDDDVIIEPYSASVVNKLFDVGKTCDNIISLYPEHSGEIRDIFWERE